MKCFAFSKEISERVRPHAAEIANDAWIIGHLDLIHCQGSFHPKGKQSFLSCQKIRDSTLHVCHPLVKNAVANDVHFGQDLTAIVITGPNTGGRPLCLKLWD